MKRLEIKSITIKFIGGKEGVVSPEISTAIFFNKKHIDEILVPFYNTIDRRMTREMCIEAFGLKTTAKLFEEGEMERSIDKDFIETVWNSPNDEGQLPGVIVNNRGCSIFTVLSYPVDFPVPISYSIPGMTVKRQEIESITLRYEDEKEFTLTTEDTTALFFDKKHIDEILVPFYNRIERYVTKEEALRVWGHNITNKLFEYGCTERRIDQSFIDLAWNTPNDKMRLASIFKKDPDCTIMDDVYPSDVVPDTYPVNPFFPKFFEGMESLEKSKGSELR